MENQETGPGEVEERHLRSMSSPDLVRHIVEELKLFVRAEVLHAKAELRDEVQAAKASGIMLGVGASLSLVGIAVLLVALAAALPIAEGFAALIVGGFVLVVGIVCAAVGYGRLPKKPMTHTQERLKHDYRITRERLS